jgi:curli biogenesis system outer membrane secretion channel CsgG
MPKQERGSRSFLFDDQLAGTKGLNIGEKVADALIAKIAGNGTFEVVDRQYLDRIVAEQNLKMDTRFDPANAAKLGKLANVDVLITGQVDAFSADAPSETSNGFFSNKTKVTGEIELRVTARMISVETASILAAPTATSDLNQVLSEKTDVLPSSQGSISSKTTGTGNIKAALLKLVDKSVEAVSLDLAGQIEANVSKVVGMDGSLVLINRGANTGIKSGQQFVVVRLIDTGLKDPDTGQAITKKKKICTITITDVDETTASGNMEGEQPKAGDELKTIQGN